MDNDNIILQRVKNGTHYRTLEMRAVDGMPEGSCIVEGYATTFNEPYDLYRSETLVIREQVAPSAFEQADLSDVIFQYDHQGRVFARTRNNTLTLRTDDHGLLITADLGGTEEGRKLYDEIRGGYIDRMSFAFTVSEDSEVRTVDHENSIVDYLRTITKINRVYDVSAVSIPANDGTSISARNYSSGILEKEKAEAERARMLKLLKLKLKLGGITDENT